jgi:hypothetical protein
VTAFFQQVGFAFKCFFLVLFAGRLPDELPARFLRRPPPGTAGRDDAVSPVETVADRGALPGPQPPSGRTVPAARAGAPVLTVAERGGPFDRAVQVLALLQRDGRLVDFLYEDISSYPDDQVGAAAREVHGSCREVLRRYLTVEPVVDEEEGRPMMVPAGFDPAELKLVGSIAGRPPYRGVIRHRGWRAAKVELPALPDGAARSVIAPAEVEVE